MAAKATLSAVRNIRLLPIVILAAGALLLLKLMGFALGPQAQISGTSVVVAQENDAEDVDPTGAEDDLGEVTTERPEGTVLETTTAADETGGVRSAADTLAERLSERRQVLEQRESEMDMRENLLAAAEARIDERIEELRKLEARLNQLVQARDDVEAQRFKNLVDMYQNMKPKDAARVFEGLDTRILVDVASDMDPRSLGEVISKMSPEAAQRLTIELMRKSAAQEEPLSVDELPQIVGTADSG
jgi:flagellar motility protein MotE (MotC chaperone)